MFGQMKVKVHAPQLGVRGEHSNNTSPQEGVKHTPGEDQRPRFSYPADLRMPAGPQVGKATVAPQPDAEKPLVHVTVRRKRHMEPH